MTYNSPTAYRGQAVPIKFGSGLIGGLTRSGKDRIFHQLMRAYGDENVVLVNNGGPLDSIINENPLIENARTYDEIGLLLAALDKKVADKEELPLVLYHEDLTKFGDKVEAKWDNEKILKSTGLKDRKIEKYSGVRVDGVKYIDRFNMLPLINIYCLTETPDGRLMFPGAAFINQLTRMVGFIITLRRYVDEDKEGIKSFRCHFDTMGRGGEFGGDRTGVLLPEEPPDLPDILQRLYGLEPIHKYTVAIDGEVTRDGS